MLGAIDQAILSLFSLLLGIAFVRFSSESEYASYSLLLAAILLVQSVQNALVNSPTTTLLPAQLTDVEKEQIFASSFLIQCYLTVFFALCGTVFTVYVAYTSAVGSFNYSVIGAATFAAIGLLWREYIRGTCYLRHSALAALKGDLLYLSIATTGLASLAAQFGLTAAVVFFCIGAAGLIASVINAPPQGIHWRLHGASTGKALVDILACSKWALPSVIVSWMYANGFLYAVAYFKDESAVAEISASRLFLVPISLLVIGWSSVYRPRISQLLAAKMTALIDHTIRISAVVIVFITIAFGLMILAAMPLIDKWLLGSKYGDLSPLVTAWATFFAIASIRTICMSAMLASKEAFRPLFYFGCVALVIAAPIVIIGCLSDRIYSVIYALAAAEAVLASIIWFFGWPRIKSEERGAGSGNCSMIRPTPAPQNKTKVLLVDTLSATNDFGVELSIALDPLVNLTVFTIKGTRLKRGDCARIIEAFPEYWGSRGKLAKLFDQFTATWRLAIELVRHRGGVVHIQFFRYPIIEIPVYVLFRPVLRSLVFTAHNALPHESKPWHRLAYRLWYSMVDQVHVLSHYTGEQLSKSLGVSPAKIVYAPHGNYDHFISDTPPEPPEITRRALGISENEKLILFFGLIRPYKGVDRLIDIVDHLTMVNIRILIAGGCANPLLTEIRQKISVKDAQHRISFLPGFVENRQLSNFLAAADLIVFPYTHIYQSGAVLLAMSFGKPVITSDIEGFREYVKDGKTGWLTDTSNAKTFADSIEKALLNGVTLINVGKAARYSCDTDFSWQQIALTITLKLYRGKL